MIGWEVGKKKRLGFKGTEDSRMAPGIRQKLSASTVLEDS